MESVPARRVTGERDVPTFPSAALPTRRWRKFLERLEHATPGSTERTVNRTVPIVDPVPEIPEFPEAPTDADITAARVFGEPFIALDGQTTGEENRAFGDAILSYLQNGNNEDTSAFGSFLTEYPNSAWRPSLLANLGAHYQRTGYYTLAGETLQDAWELTREPSSPAGLAVTLSVLADFLELKMKFGNVEELETILSQAEGLELHGTAVERVSQACCANQLMRRRAKPKPPSPSSIPRRGHG